MSTGGDSLAQKVQVCYLELSAIAFDLNGISDELGKSITEIDSAIKKLNLGVSVWAEITSQENLPFYSSEEIGYAKIGGKWGIALRTVQGCHVEEDADKIEAWLFNDAPRSLRLAAIEKLPDMLRKLSAAAAETTKNLTSKLAEAQEIAAAVRNAADRAERAVVIGPKRGVINQGQQASEVRSPGRRIINNVPEPSNTSPVWPPK